MIEELKYTEINPEFFMMGSNGFHPMGCKTEGENLCVVYGETDKLWVARLVFAFKGFVKFRFPKESTRKLTQDEIEKYSAILGVKIEYEYEPGESILTSEQIVKGWIDAFNRRDLEAFLAFYSKDITYHNPLLPVQMPISGGKIKGKAILREFFKERFEELPKLRYEIRHMQTNDRYAVMEYIQKDGGINDARNVCETFIIKDGRIIESALYRYV